MQSISGVRAEMKLCVGSMLRRRLAHQWTRLLYVGGTTTTELVLETHIY
jgi:hypothetical protein